MSIEHLKKQAKNLKRFLPAFMAAHPDGGTSVQCLELVAKTHGYPNLHAATQNAQAPGVRVKSRATGIYEDMFALQASTRAAGVAIQDDLWNKHALSLCEAILPLVIFRERIGLPVGPNFAHLPELAAAFNDEVDADRLDGWQSQSVRQYLRNFCDQHGEKMVPTSTSSLHDYTVLIVPSLRGTMNKSTPRPMIDKLLPSAQHAIVKQDDAPNHYSMTVGEAMFEEDLRAMVNSLIYKRAVHVEIVGDHKGIDMAVRMLTLQGMTVQVGRKAFAKQVLPAAGDANAQRAAADLQEKIKTQISTLQQASDAVDASIADVSRVSRALNDSAQANKKRRG